MGVRIMDRIRVSERLDDDWNARLLMRISMNIS